MHEYSHIPDYPPPRYSPWMILAVVALFIALITAFTCSYAADKKDVYVGGGRTVYSDPAERSKATEREAREQRETARRETARIERERRERTK